MIEVEEPPTERTFNQSVTREFVDIDVPGDLEVVLMEPNPKEGILAVFNPSTCKTSENPPWPFVYRYEKQENGKRYSEIALTYLLNPVELSGRGRTIITRTEDCESWGCEDPSLSLIKGVFYIPYVAWDGVSARICLAITDDFRDIQKFGVIGPQIPLKEASDLFPNDIYRKVLKRYLKSARKRTNGDIERACLWDKDPVLDFDFLNEEWVLVHRIDPFIHFARANSLEDFKDKEYWIAHIRNIDDYRIDTDLKERWEVRKRGLGCLTWLGDKKVGLYHGVNFRSAYRGGICELDPHSYRMVSRLRDPLLRPDKPIHCFNFLDDEGRLKKKKVVFPRGSLVDEESRRLYVYQGIGDGLIGVRSTDMDWVYRELNSPHNRLLQQVS